MDANVVVAIGAGFLVFIAGMLMGYFGAKIIIAKRNKKIMKNLVEVLDGKRENFIEIEGVKYPAEKFRLRNNKNQEILIDLKGGSIKQNVSKKNFKKERGQIFKKDNHSLIRKNSRGFREEERTIRGGSGRRIRRFG